VDAYGFSVRFEETHGYTISRSTGLSRMAAVPALISLVFMLSGRPLQRVVSVAVFAASFSVMWIMQARGAFFAFIGAVLFILLLSGPQTRRLLLILVIFVCSFAAVGMVSEGSVHELWLHITRNEGAEGFSSMSGRNVIWQQVVDLWLQSPLFGYGPQADRLFETELPVGNAQNVILYSLLCSGIVGASFFAIALIDTLRSTVFVTLRMDVLAIETKRMAQISAAIIVFSLFRGIPENNEALFSVDLLIKYPAAIYIVLLSRTLRLHEHGRI
jgi:O-antigen ligase